LPEYTFPHQGLERTYRYFAPDNLPAGAPLVVVLHGFTSSADRIMDYTGMNKLAAEHGFAVAYPQGTRDQEGRTFWNVGYDFHAELPVDDVDFIVSLVRHLQDTFALSRKHTFLTGMSNGGDMCYLMACRHPEVFAAIAPVCGTMMQHYFSDCRPEAAPPLLAIASTADSTTLYSGDPDNADGWGAYAPMPEIIDFWTGPGPPATVRTDTLPDRDPTDGSTVVREHYTLDAGRREYVFYRIVGGGHDWPGASGNRDIRASAEIWRFFARQVR
jgi:polyhydroxybutyrate depolymerase